MGKVFWSEPAIEDLRSAVEYIAQDSPTYAERFGVLLLAALKRLEEFPRSGRIVPEFEDPSIREMIYGSYRVIYLVRGEGCHVVALVHASRDIVRHLSPGDWDVE